MADLKSCAWRSNRSGSNRNSRRFLHSFHYPGNGKRAPDSKGGFRCSHRARRGRSVRLQLSCSKLSCSWGIAVGVLTLPPPPLPPPPLPPPRKLAPWLAPQAHDCTAPFPCNAQHGMTPRNVLAAVCAGLLAVMANGYVPAICQDQCGSKRQFSDPNNLPGEMCFDNGPCGALMFPGRQVLR